VCGLYLLMPIIAYLRRKPLTGTLDPQWYADDTPREPLTATETALEREGFSPPTRLSAEGARAVAHMSVLRHKDGTTVATVAIIIAATTGRRTRSLLFRSHLADERVMITTNQSSRLFPSMPYHDGMRFLTVRDPAALWTIHQRRLAHARVVPVIPDGDVVGYVNREARRLREAFIAMGYIRKESDGTERVTLLGAALLAWRRTFPWKQMNDWRDARAAAVYLA
jgi:hypothetical protein